MEGGPLGEDFHPDIRPTPARPGRVSRSSRWRQVRFLEGMKLKPGFGPRIHFYAWPKLVFRILDTGGAFKGDGKRIRNEGYEPFDIATSYAGGQRKQVDRQKFSTYWIDWQDVLVYPADLRRKLTHELKRESRTLPEGLKRRNTDSPRRCRRGRSQRDETDSTTSDGDCGTVRSLCHGGAWLL